MNTLLPTLLQKSTNLVDRMAELGKPIRVTEGYRSVERQNALYAQGRTTPGQVVTNAKGGQSLHNYGVAFDVVFLAGYNVPESWWQELGAEGEKLGLEWGGRWVKFVDRPHFQLLLGYTLADFQNNKVDYSKYEIQKHKKYIFKRNLEEGDNGDDVQALQEQLKILGFFPQEQKTTDTFGPVTEKALIAYKASKLDSKFDRNTRRMLSKEIKELML